MTCETCGDKKPKNDSPSFTKATVEILNPKELALFRKVTVPASMGDDTDNPPRVGKYCNVILYYEANNQAYIYSSDGIPTRITEDLTPILNKLKELDDEDKKIWEEIEEIEMSSDVVDIVGTYAELQQYDTSKLHDNDIIKVLQDETHLNETAYYRWSTATDTFSYVGSEGPYYTESEVDALLADKQDTLIAGANIQIAADGKTISATDTTYTHFTGATASTDGVQGLVPGPVAGDQDKYLKADGTWDTVSGANYTAGDGIDITNDEISVDDTYVQKKLTAGSNIQINGTTISATDTTYSDFVGTDGQTAGTAGLVPAPATTDAGKFLKADGTWDDAGSPINVVQTIGTSTADVMSQDATSGLIYLKRSGNYEEGILNIGTGLSQTGVHSHDSLGIAIGKRAYIDGQGAISIGSSNSNILSGWTETGGNYAVAIGTGAKALALNAVSIGYGSYTAIANTVSFGGGSIFRRIVNIGEPVNARDAATKNYVDTAVTPNNISSNDWSSLWQ